MRYYVIYVVKDNVKIVNSDNIIQAIALCEDIKEYKLKMMIAKRDEFTITPHCLKVDGLSFTSTIYDELLAKDPALQDILSKYDSEARGTRALSSV